MLSRFLRFLILLASVTLSVQGHVGSPDIYLDGNAGPYRLFVTVRPPLVIPGVAELEIRSETPGVERIHAVPLPMSGRGARFAPVPDELKVSPDDRQFFTGSLWMMATGSWQVKITAAGSRGQGTLAVPVPSAALSTKKMQSGLAAMLFGLMTFLVLGVVAVAGASVREAKLPAGVVPDRSQRQNGRVAMCCALALVLVALWYGRSWWNSEANRYSQNVYKPLNMKAAINDSGVLTLTLSDPGWLNNRSRAFIGLAPVRTVDDLILDHNHLMHLYLIRQPGLDVVFHLHPALAGPAVFELALPSMPEGNYQLYADIVHESGFPETLVTSLFVPLIRGRRLSGDDASGSAPAWNHSPAVSKEFSLPDGYLMQWVRPNGSLHVKRPELFRFRLLDSKGQTPRDMAMYMGMLGHAAFVKTDGTTFAHIHPNGSVSMAAYMKAQGQDSAAGAEVPAMNMSNGNTLSALPNEVTFPYGLPSAGNYRIFVQMKHGSTVETGIFDERAE